MAWEKCFGEICTSVSYSLKGVDSDHLSYVYRAVGSSHDENGTLGSGNVRYKLMWYVSLVFVRWMFPPFSGLSPKCGDGCTCALGAPTTETQRHSYTASFNLPSGSRIAITGNFDVEVTTRTGVCVPAPGTKFALGPEQQADAVAFIGQFLTDFGSPTEEPQRT